MAIPLMTAFVAIRPDLTVFRQQAEAALKKAMAGLSASVPLDVDTTKAKLATDDMKKRFADFAKSKPTATVTADTTKAMYSTDKLKAELAGLGSKITELHFEADDKAAKAAITNLRLRMVRLSESVATPRVDMKGIASAEAGIAAVSLALDKLSAKTATPDVNVNRRGGLLGRLAGALSPAGGQRTLGQAFGAGQGASGLLTSPAGIGAIAGGGLLAAGAVPGVVGLGLGGGVGLGALAGGLFGAAQGTKVIKADEANIKSITVALKSAIGKQKTDLSRQLKAANKQYTKDLTFFQPFLGLQGAIKALAQNFLAPLRPIMAPLTKIVGQFGKGLVTLGPQFTALFKASLPFLNQFMQVLLQAGKILLPAFTGALQQMVKSGALKTMTDGLITLVNGLAGFVTALGPGMAASAEIFARLMTATAWILVALGKSVSFIAQLLTFDLPGGFEKGWAAVVSVSKAGARVVMGVLRSIVSFAQGIWGGITHAATQAWAGVTKAFFAAYHFLLPLFRVIGKVGAAMFYPVKVAAQIAFDILYGLVLAWWHFARPIFAGFGNLAREIFQHILAPVAKAAFFIIGAAVKGFWLFVRPILILFRDVGRAVFDAVRDRAKSGMDFIKGFLRGMSTVALAILRGIRDLAKIVWDRFTGFMRTAMNLGKSLIRGLWNVIASVFGFIINGAAKAFSWVPGLGPKLKDAAQKFNQFRDNVNRAITGVNGKTVTVGVRMTAATNPYKGGISGRAARGMYVSEGTTPTADDVLIRASKGELVVPTRYVRAGAVDHLRGKIPGFAGGGSVGGPKGGEVRVRTKTTSLAGIQGQIAPIIERMAITFAKSAFGAGASIVRDAMRWLGKIPYVWGGTAVPGGADCSGFTSTIYGRHGIGGVPRTSEAQYAWARKSGPVPGGLAFYVSPGGGPPPGHVAIVKDAQTVISQGGGMGPKLENLRFLPLMGTGIPPGGFGTGRGGAFGGTVRENQLSSLWIQAGGPRGIAHLMAAIAMAESGGRANIVNSIGASGLWQIYGLPFPGNPLDPLTNARMAVSKYRSQGLGAWSAYTNGSYRQFMGAGGVITEPVAGVGLRSGRGYMMGERGDETVVPGRFTTARVERKLDRLIAVMERNAGDTAAGLAGALNGSAGQAAGRARYSTSGL